MFCHVIPLLRLLPRAVFLAILGFLTTTGVEASEQLSRRELQQLFPGHFEAIVQGFVVVSITARRDGSLLAEFMSKTDTGHWSIRSGKLCIRFSKWLDGRTHCSMVVEEAGWYRSDNIVFKKAEGVALATPARLQ